MFSFRSCCIIIQLEYFENASAAVRRSKLLTYAADLLVSTEGRGPTRPSSNFNNMHANEFGATNLLRVKRKSPRSSVTASGPTKRAVPDCTALLRPTVTRDKLFPLLGLHQATAALLIVPTFIQLPYALIERAACTPRHIVSSFRLCFTGRQAMPLRLHSLDPFGAAVH
jgi:hypothetical protein